MISCASSQLASRIGELLALNLLGSYSGLCPPRVFLPAYVTLTRGSRTAVLSIVRPKYLASTGCRCWFHVHVQTSLDSAVVLPEYSALYWKPWGTSAASTAAPSLSPKLSL